MRDRSGMKSYAEPQLVSLPTAEGAEEGKDAAGSLPATGRDSGLREMHSGAHQSSQGKWGASAAA